MKTFFTTLFFLTLVSTAVNAMDITSEPGYVNFDSLEADYGEPKVLINLNQTMLGFVSKLNVADNDTAELISNLKAVRVQIYNTGENNKPALKLMDKVASEIKNQHWLPIVSINEKQEKIRIFTKITNDIMDGLVVMIINTERDNKEAIFINIIGQIDPAQINKVTNALNINTGMWTWK